MRSMADLSPTAHADLPAADEPPTLEAAALARALGREAARAKRRGTRHIVGAEFPNEGHERASGATSRPAASPQAPQRNATPTNAPAPVRATPAKSTPAKPARQPGPPQVPKAVPRPFAKRPEAKPTLDALRKRIEHCMDCGLSDGARGSGALVGRGSHAPRLILIGDFGGPQERQYGKPFGPAEGELIANLVKKGFGLSPNEVYVTNAVKCPLAQGCQPSPAETKTCARHLDAELALLATDSLAAILAFGPVAASALNLAGRHNQALLYKVGERSIPLVLTSPPRDMLADVSVKNAAWGAMKALLEHFPYPGP